MNLTRLVVVEIVAIFKGIKILCGQIINILTVVAEMESVHTQTGLRKNYQHPSQTKSHSFATPKIAKEISSRLPNMINKSRYLTYQVH